MPLLRDKDGFHLRLGRSGEFLRLEPDGVQSGSVPQLLVVTLLSRQLWRGSGPKAIVVSGDLIQIHSAEGNHWLCIRDGAPATCRDSAEAAATIRIETVPPAKRQFVQYGEHRIRLYVPELETHLRRPESSAVLTLGSPDDQALFIIERP